MGSKLAILAAVTVLLGARLAAAETPAELAKKQGLALYKAGKYAEAATALAKSQSLEPRSETLFALAQAQRLAGDCTSAALHYHELIEQVTDLNIAKAVQQNLMLCEKPEPPKVVEVAPKVVPMVTPEPVIQTRTVVREVRRTDTLAVVLLSGGALALGVSGGLFVAARSDRDAANTASSLVTHDRLADRADLERNAMFVAAGAGALLISVAAVRWALGRDAAKATEVTLAPTASGTLMVLTSSW